MSFFFSQDHFSVKDNVNVICLKEKTVILLNSDFKMSNPCIAVQPYETGAQFYSKLLWICGRYLANFQVKHDFNAVPSINFTELI